MAFVRLIIRPLCFSVQGIIGFHGIAARQGNFDFFRSIGYGFVYMTKEQPFVMPVLAQLIKQVVRLFSHFVFDGNSPVLFQLNAKRVYIVSMNTFHRQLFHPVIGKRVHQGRSIPQEIDFPALPMKLLQGVQGSASDRGHVRQDHRVVGHWTHVQKIVPFILV